MTLTNTRALLFIFLLLASGVWSPATEVPAHPEALISQALVREDFWSVGIQPMLLRAEVQVPDAKGGLLNGDYTLTWFSPSQWTETIRFGDYQRMRVGVAKGYFQKSNLAYQPEVMFQLDPLLHFKQAVRLKPKQTLGKIKVKEKAGVRQLCTEVKRNYETERILCFDSGNGALTSVEYLALPYESAPVITRTEYSGFNKLDDKLVPYEVHAYQDRKVIAAVKVLEITKISEMTPELFDVPATAEFWAQCDDQRDPQLEKWVQPEYPQISRDEYEQGKVVIYAIVESDGSVSHLAIIRHATPMLDARALRAVRYWRYKPSSCEQMPVRVETSIDVDLRLTF
jgi:TonB family protein